MSRPASQMRMPPPLADTSTIGPEHNPLDPAAGACLHYLEHGSNSQLIRWHHHASYELHLIVATRGQAYIGDSVSRFAPHSLVLVGPHLPHNWVSDAELPVAPLRDRVVQFSEQFLQCCEMVLPHPRGIETLREQAAYGIEFPQRLGRQLGDHFVRLGQTQGLRRLSIFFDLLAALCDEPERRRLSQRAFRTPLPGGGAQQIDRVIEYIRRHYARDISLGQLAAEFRMSDSAFSRMFQRHSGYGFADYLNQTRVRQACERLATTADAVTQICFDVGYSNLSNFNRRFRALTGVTPREYRLRYRRLQGGSVLDPADGK
ncbi:AraC family transcriptional regulator [Frateuria aurantia]